MKREITFDRAARFVGAIALVLTIFFLINYLSGVLLPFAVAWLLAYLMMPLVKFVQYKMHVKSRVASIVISMVAVVAVIVGVVWMIIPPMIEQFEKLGDLIAAYVQTSSDTESLPGAARRWASNHRQQIEEFLYSSNFTDGLKSALPSVFSVVGKTASVAMSVVASLITLLYMFFIMLDYEYLCDNWIKIFPKKNRPFWRALASDAESELNKYLRGQGLVALIMGILFCIGFTIIDFPMAIGLGIMIGIMDMVPYLHTFALIPTVGLALLKAADTGQNFWWILIGALAVFLIVQLICDLIVTPKVMGSAMGLNPAVLLLSLSVWGALLGFIGLIIALPLTTLLMAYYQRYITHEDEIDDDAHMIESEYDKSKN